MNAVDTNVFIYTLDADEAVKQAKALELLDRLAQPPTETILLWQVASEFLSQLRRWESQNRLAPAAVQSAFDRLRMTFPLQIPSEAVFGISFALRFRFNLSHWDSMILAACKDAGVTTLFTEDLDAGTDDDGLTVVNPFA
jgi:predicted nucleic acid-binding protein